MNVKFFVKVFFEKTKYLLFYSLSIVTFWFVMFIPVSFDAETSYYEKITPDIEINGRTSGMENSYMLYEEINIQDGLGAAAENNFEEGGRSYGLTVRELFTFSDAYYQVSYRIYGADDTFLQVLSDYLKRGHLPEPGKAEAVIGSNVAAFYDLRTGDTIEVPVALEEDPDAAVQEYVVSGILDAKASFFRDGIYVSRDTYESLEHSAADNILYLYADTDKAYQDILRRLEKGMDSSQFGEMICHRENKVSLQATIRSSLLNTIPFSAIVLWFLFLSLMKYSGGKIGLMKAMGLSDRHIMKMMMRGFGIYNLTAMLMSYLSLGLIRLTAGFPFPVSVLMYSIYSFGIIFLVTMMIIFILCKRISPSVAMYQY